MKKLIRYFTIRKRIQKQIEYSVNLELIYARMALDAKSRFDVKSYNAWNAYKAKQFEISEILRNLL